MPEPDEEGVWFYIDFHDPDSRRQIHTQPMVPRYRYRDRNVMYLIREGSRTTHLSNAILQILQSVGVTGATDR